MSDPLTPICPAPLTTSCPQHPLSQAQVPNFNQMWSGTGIANYVSSIQQELCLGATSCGGSVDLQGHYWAGMQCVEGRDFNNASYHLYPVVLAGYQANITMPRYCYQQFLVSSHLLVDGFTSGAGTASNPIDIPLIEEQCPEDTVSVFFLLDNSSSVSVTEFDQMRRSVVSTIRDITGPMVKYSVANFANQSSYDRVVDLTSDLADTTAIVRTLSGGTHVPNAFDKTKLYMDMDSVEGRKFICLLTDARSNQFYSPPFNIYNELKASPYNSEIIVVRYQTGTSNDAVANTIAAAIASKGGTYSGAIANNPDDPQGAGGPRKLIPLAFTETIPYISADILHCDTISVVPPAECENPIYTWHSSDGGQILSDSVNVQQIVTNGVGSYSVTIVCSGGCTYEIDYGSSQPNGSNGGQAARSGYLRYEYGRVVDPYSREEDPASSVHEAIQMLPNPATEMIYFHNVELGSTVFIYDTQGRMVANTVLTDYSQALNINTLLTGVYIVEVYSGGTFVKAGKLVKI